MNITRNLIVALTLASLGVVGTAQARDGDGSGRQRGDGARVEQNDFDPSGYRGGDPVAVGDSDGRFERRVERRQDHQQSRIDHGRRNGDLTRDEARRLRGEQQRIDRMARRYGSDGYYSRHERYRLARAQHRADHRIYRARHNDRYRGHGRHDHRRGDDRQYRDHRRH